jgi:hypothetical protein
LIEDRSLEAAEVYELACDEFLEAIGRQYADEIVADDIIGFRRRWPGAA